MSSWTHSRCRSRLSSATSSTCAIASTHRWWDADAGGYRYDAQWRAGPRFVRPGLWFSEAEAFALVMMEHLLASLDQGGLIGPHIAPLRARQLPYRDDRELLLEIMKHGPGVEVLAPAGLRQKLRDAHLAAADVNA